MTDRDLLAEIGKLRFRVQELERERTAARNSALDEASNVAWSSPDSHWGPQIAVSIEALKELDGKE